MSEALFADLSWLQRAPSDFRQRCREASEHDSTDGRLISALSKFALDESQLRHLTETMGRVKKRRGSLAPLEHFKLAIVGNATLEPLVPALIASAPRHGFDLECITSDFGQTIQTALAPDSLINVEQPDAVLLALDYRGLPLNKYAEDATTASGVVQDSITLLETLRAGFRTHGKGVNIVQTLAPPPEALFGSFDLAMPATVRGMTNAFNATLVERVRDSGDVIFDVAALAETVGLANWYSPTQWHMAKLAFDARFLPLYADHVVRVIAALRGKSRRCLILDLDNTVWGGIIGDDGLEGIVVGQGDATGEAYIDVQSAALALRDRGIILAVSSKNDDDVARAAFLRHPEMLLRESHIAVFQANWNDKATNIAAIAAELSLGLDAMVFLDDNPAERALIRQLLPDVAVPELPDDPALYARTLFAAGYFESTSFSIEDRTRNEFYEQNVRRAAFANQAPDLQSYLRSLEMEIIFQPFDATGRNRITQLVNKSNQFNLTTHRYTGAQIGALEADANCFTLQVRLLDAFGDNGMISVVVCRPLAARQWEIDTWLMSCRVLGRGVERMVLRELIYHARLRQVDKLIGIYIPTERNRLVAEHYRRLGFALVREDPTGATTWELSTATEVETAPMRVKRIGFELSAA